MEFTNYVRKPFIVKAIQVTEENIAELAPLIGTLRQKDDGTPYIQVNRKLVPNVFRVYPGFWMTQMGENVHCYSKRFFTDQFVEATYEVTNWVDYLNSEPEENVRAVSSDVVEHNVFDESVEQPQSVIG